MTSETMPAPDDIEAGPTTTIIQRTLRWLVRRRLMLFAAFVLAAVGLTCVLFFAEYRPDRQVDDAVSRAVVSAASDGTVASLSYSPDGMDRDIATAKSHLTGEFLAYYTKFAEQVVAPMVREGHLTQTATVVKAAVSELHPDSAVVLMFLNETTKSGDKPDPATIPSSVRVTLTKADGRWLISKMDPLA